MRAVIGYRNLAAETPARWDTQPAMDNLDALFTPSLADQAVSSSDGPAEVDGTLRLAAVNGPAVHVGMIALLGLDYEPPVLNTAQIEAYRDVLGLVGGGSIAAALTHSVDEFPRHAIVVFDQPVECHAIRFYWEFTGGRVRIGGLWAGPTWSPPDTIGRQWRTRLIDPSAVATSDGGHASSARRPLLRELTLDWSALPRYWAYGGGAPSMDLQRLTAAVGLTKPLIVLPRTRTALGLTDWQGIARLGLYGRFTDLGSLSHAAGDLYSASWTFREAL
jgi:hypothetical protein